MSVTFNFVVVVAANLLGAVMAAPQARRIVVSRSIAGVSASWAAVSLFVNGWWLAYGIARASWAIVPVSAVSVTLYLAIAVSMLRFGTTRTLPAATVGLTVATVPLVALIGGGWNAVGLTLGALYAVQLLPAVSAAYRSHDISAISVSTWVMAWVESVLWGLYGLPRRDVGLITLAATGLVMSTLMLARLASHRHQASAVSGDTVSGDTVSGDTPILVLA